MEKQRYKISDDAGNSIIALKEDERFVSVGEMAQHVAIDILEDYRDIKNGIKKAEETDIKLSEMYTKKRINALRTNCI